MLQQCHQHTAFGGSWDLSKTFQNWKAITKEGRVFLERWNIMNNLSQVQMLDRTMVSWAGTLIFVLQQLAIEAANWLVDHQRPQAISGKVCRVRALSVSSLCNCHILSHLVTVGHSWSPALHCLGNHVVFLFQSLAVPPQDSRVLCINFLPCIRFLPSNMEV